MNFEDALRELRNGKKIRSPFFEDDEYLMGCYLGLPSYYDDNGNLVEDSWEAQKARGMSIVKMKGEEQSPDMYPSCVFPQDKCSINPQLHSYPQLNLLLIMRDDWEVIE